MAKKKKVQKQSIKKRQTDKANKRKLVKRKLSAQKSPQKQMSMAKVKKNLKALPGLVFEPEFSALSFSAEALTAAQASSEIQPEQIDFAAAQGDFDGQFSAALKEMDVRFAKTGDANKQMMTQAMLYFLEQEQTPACMNQLTVALFLNALHKQETNEDYSFPELEIALKAYDDTNEAYLEGRATELASAAQTVEGAVATDDEEESAPLGAAAFSTLMGQIEDWAETVEGDQSERLVDDMTALFEDYASEKEWSELSDVTPKRVQTFIGWFERNMNPTQEDLKSLKDSLGLFFASELAQKELGEQTCGTILATL